MSSHINDISLNKAARIAGVLFLIIAICAGFSMMYVPSSLLCREMLQQQPIILWLIKDYSVSVLLVT